MRYFKDYRSLAILGLVTVIGSFLLQRLAPDTGLVSFAAGTLLGMSLAFNIKALLLHRARHNR